MKLFDRVKKGWENIWLPRLQEGKTKIELERDKRYEARWVWYHTILAVFLGLSTFLLLYFFFNLLDGQRGLFSYFKKKNLLENLQNEEIELISKIKDLETKNSLLTNNLDLDYIEILIREKFLFGKKNETLYIIKNHVD